MRLKTLFLGAAAALAAAAPITAQAAGAVRASAAVEGENALGYEGSATQLIVLAAIVAVIFVGVELTDNDDEPSSP